MSATLSSVFGGANGGISGAVVTAWATERFTTPPALDAAFPSGSPTAGPVTAGDSFGCAGAWRLTVGTAGSYYVCAVFNNVRYWSLMGTGGGGSTGAVERFVLQFRFDTPDLATGIAIPGYVPKKGDTILNSSGVCVLTPWVGTGNMKWGLYLDGAATPIRLGTQLTGYLTETGLTTGNKTLQISEQYEFCVVAEDCASVKLYCSTNGGPTGEPLATPIAGVGFVQILVIPAGLEPTTPTLPVQAALTAALHPTYSLVVSATPTHNVLTLEKTGGPTWAFTVAPGTYVNGIALADALRAATVKKTGVSQAGTLATYLSVYIEGTGAAVVLRMKPANATFTGAAGNAFSVATSVLARQLWLGTYARIVAEDAPTLPWHPTGAGTYGYVVVKVGTTTVFFYSTPPIDITTPVALVEHINALPGPTVTGTHLPFSHYATAGYGTGRVEITVKASGPWGGTPAATVKLHKYADTNDTGLRAAGFFPTALPTVQTYKPFSAVARYFVGGEH